MVKICFNKIKFIFFDFDGVIADTEWLHFNSFNEVLKKYKIKISKKEYFGKYMACDDKGCFKDVFFDKKRVYLSGKEIRCLISEKTKILMSEIKKNIKYYPDTVEFIQKVKKFFPDIRFGIVSGALRKEIKYILTRLKLSRYFSFIISAEDVKNGKPNPEPFIKAIAVAKKFFNGRLSAEEVIVVEDSINGLKSSKKLGFNLIAVAHTYPGKKLNKIGGAIIVVKKMTDISFN